MGERFQFSLGRLMGSMTLFAFGALFAREYLPILFVVGGCAIGSIFRKPGCGLWGGVWLFGMLSAMTAPEIEFGVKAKAMFLFIHVIGCLYVALFGLVLWVRLRTAGAQNRRSRRLATAEPSQETGYRPLTRTSAFAGPQRPLYDSGSRLQRPVRNR